MRTAGVRGGKEKCEKEMQSRTAPDSVVLCDGNVFLDVYVYISAAAVRLLRGVGSRRGNDRYNPELLRICTDVVSDSGGAAK